MAEEATPAVLVDTSVWVAFLRGAHTPEVGHLDLLLSEDAVATCAPIRAEVLSGASSKRELLHFTDLFQALPLMPLPDDAWERAAGLRFALARRGFQMALVDLLIALTAAHHRTPLFSLDQDFQRMRPLLDLPLYAT